MENSHPPIPRTINMIRKPSDLCPGRFHWTIGSCRYIYFEDDTGDRPIVAAIARCAWLDIGLKQGKKASGSAFENSELWRQWGEQK